MYSVTYWRWIDVDARPQWSQRAASLGPFEGACPMCGSPAVGEGAWLRIRSMHQEAALVLPPSRRAFVVEELRAHLDALARRGEERTELWMLSPQVLFGEVPQAMTAVGQVGEEPMGHGHSRPPEVPKRSGSRPEPISDEGVGVPQVISADHGTPAGQPPSLGAVVCELTREGGTPTVQAAVPAAQVEEWRDAKLEARPVLLRGFGYPLLGVRIIASYMGQRGCIDAVLDVAGEHAAEVFDMLAARFEIRVHLSGPETPSMVREVAGLGLEPNAALCLDAARRELERVHDGSYRKARALLAASDVEARLSPPEVTLARGSYQHIITATEAWRALEHLERVAQREHLVRLLEVEGLPLPEYETIRRRVLQGALEFGLAAPRRFWRRVIALGLAQDLQDYADRLAQQRAKHAEHEDDLSPDHGQAAWQNIARLCEAKGLAVPDVAAQALALTESASPGAGPSDGEAGAWRDWLRDPAVRLRTATELLRARSHRGLALVVESLAGFSDDEVVALLPELADLGRRAVPSLIPLLESPRAALRQMAAILLGMSSEPDALDPLCARLLVEESEVWVDVAQAIAAYDVAAVDALEEVFESHGAETDRMRAVERGARVLAEVVLQGGDLPSRDARPEGQLLYRLLQENGLMAAAARQALATLPQVRRSSAARRGELPVVSPTDDERFARRAYEAILIPELEVEAEA